MSASDSSFTLTDTCRTERAEDEDMDTACHLVAWILVWVKLQGKLSEGLLDFILLQHRRSTQAKHKLYELYS